MFYDKMTYGYYNTGQIMTKKPDNPRFSDDFGRFIGTSQIMQEVYTKIEKLSCLHTPVFIEGESGTGKEICAQALHFYSDRNTNPFIAINCAAIPENLIESTLFGHVKGAFTGADTNRDGAIESAQNGTLFLDEVGDLPLNLQTKLLRFTQDYTYSKVGSDKVSKANIRIVCASNKCMSSLVKQDIFREDLYYRLYVTPITMPPLRKRGDDVLDIADYYLKKYSDEQLKPAPKFSDNAADILLGYEWPGNIRELQNAIRQIVALENSPLIIGAMLPAILQEKQTPIKGKQTDDYQPLSMPLWQIEKQAIKQAIHYARGDIIKAAAILDIAPSTIYRKMKFWQND